MHIRALLKAILKTTFIIVSHVNAIPTYLMWIFTLRPLLHIKPDLYHWIEGTLFGWLFMLASQWQWMDGYYGKHVHLIAHIFHLKL